MTLFLNYKVINHDNFVLTFWWPGKAPSFISASTKPSSSNVTTSPLSASFHLGEVTLWTSLIATDLCTVLVFAQYIPTWKASCKWKITNYHLLKMQYTPTRPKCSFQYEVNLISSFSPSNCFCVVQGQMKPPCRYGTDAHGGINTRLCTETYY